MSFWRFAMAFEIQRSWSSRQSATTPFVPGDSNRTSQSFQPFGNTAVRSTTPWA